MLVAVREQKAIYIQGCRQTCWCTTLSSTQASRKQAMPGQCDAHKQEKRCAAITWLLCVVGAALHPYIYTYQNNAYNTSTYKSIYIHPPLGSAYTFSSSCPLSGLGDSSANLTQSST